MTREQVLRSCLAGMLHGEDRFEQADEKHADWIIERLAWHKILPLAAHLSDHRRLQSPTLQRSFLSTVVSNAARERHYRNQAADVIGEMRATAIDVIPYKGPFWGVPMYPEYSWRHIGDIDLMMQPDEARTAARLLRARGYRPDVVGDSEDDDFEHRGLLTYFPPASEENLVPVQIHWALLSPRRFLRLGYLRYEDLTTRTTEAAWNAIRYRLPPPEVRFLYMALHGTCQHQFMRFVQIMDLARFLRTYPQLDWQAVETLVHERQARVPVHYALKFVGNYFELPAEALSLRARLAPPLRARVVAGLLRPEATLLSTERRGKRRRKLFRLAMSW